MAGSIYYIVFTKWEKEKVTILIRNHFPCSLPIYLKIANFGAQSYTVSYKPGNNMLCFLCGESKAKENSLIEFDIPICKDCQKKEQSKYYRKGNATKLSLPYLVKPPVKPVTEELCEYCGKKYQSDELFEDFGFSKKVCLSCIKITDINIELSNKFIKPIWRKRHG